MTDLIFVLSLIVASRPYLLYIYFSFACVFSRGPLLIFSAYLSAVFQFLLFFCVVLDVLAASLYM